MKQDCGRQSLGRKRTAQEGLGTKRPWQRKSRASASQLRCRGASARHAGAPSIVIRNKEIGGWGSPGKSGKRSKEQRTYGFSSFQGSNGDVHVPLGHIDLRRALPKRGTGSVGPARSCPAYMETLHCRFPSALFPVLNHTVSICMPVGPLGPRRRKRWEHPHRLGASGKVLPGVCEGGGPGLQCRRLQAWGIILTGSTPTCQQQKKLGTLPIFLREVQYPFVRKFVFLGWTDSTINSFGTCPIPPLQWQSLTIFRVAREGT